MFFLFTAVWYVYTALVVTDNNTFGSKRIFCENFMSVLTAVHLAFSIPVLSRDAVLYETQQSSTILISLRDS